MNDIFDCKLLLVDDEPELRKMVGNILKQNGFKKIIFAADCSHARFMFTSEKPDGVLLDVSLPDGDGFTLMREFRTISAAPVLFLSARDEDENRLLGLGLGADDYITKPFRPRELVARIGTALRKSGRSNSNFIIQGLHVDTASGIVKKNSIEIFLSALEYRLLLVFINNPKNIITRGMLLDELWDAAGEFVNDNTLTVYIKRLRMKIEDNPADPQIILTVRGTGYRLGGGYAAE